MDITSLQNAKVKALCKYSKRSYRDKQSDFPVEGLRALSLAHSTGSTIRELYLCSSLLGDDERIFAEMMREQGDALIIEVSEAVCRKISFRDHPEGIMGMVSKSSTDLSRIEVTSDSLFVVLESVEKPGNLGAVLRTADAAGVDAVILCGDSADIYNPNVVRSSMGALFSVPLAVAAGTEIRDWCASCGVEILCASPEASISYTGCDMTGALAVVLGNEARGLSDSWREGTATLVSIPLAGKVNSLNVSTAGAILIYEAIRQRSR